MPTPPRALAVLAALVVAGSCAPSFRATPEGEPFDVLLSGGTVLDGTGLPAFRADVGIRGERIARVGDLSGSRGRVELDVTGLYVAPGFINLHSHASAAGLRTAVNMLTQGVTTELLNPDGGGPLDVGRQLADLASAGLALNAGGYAGFNTVWSAVVGAEDVRPTEAQIREMGEMIAHNLERGAWGVSAGLDYKPAYFATAEEVVRVLEPVRVWRTHFTNHDRLAPETGYSSRAGIAETLAIGEAAGLVPVVTHMKVQGHEQGSAPDVLRAMSAATAAGRYAAADVYPYLAGQTSLAALLVPGWAQEGGRPAMLARFGDPALRPRVAAEIEEAMSLRFGGPGGVYLPASRRELVDVMAEMQLSSGGEAVIRILEQESPGAILRFGAEEDLRAILRHPTAAVACDCGASAGGATHPRAFGSFPRVLGRYVREAGVLTWEDAVRRMSGLPATLVGLVDRGFIAPGMAADVTVFDPRTVIDHATYEDPGALSDGIVHVLVNGRLALRSGEPTGSQAGRPLHRAPEMPSRPMTADVDRQASARGRIATPTTNGGDWEVAFDVAQRAGERRASGTFTLRSSSGQELRAAELGLLQTAGAWASFTGTARLGSGGETRGFVVVLDPDGPQAPGQVRVRVEVEGMDPLVGVLASPR